MGAWTDRPDAVTYIKNLEKRISVIERAKSPSHYTTASRPAPADAPGALIYNTDTGKHQGSNGVIWNDCY